MKKDHRVRVAKVRRERMRARLLQAVMECYAIRVLDATPTVEDVTASAGVSRATFYKYFSSVEEAIEQRAGELVDEMIESLKDMLGSQMRPALLFTVSVRLFLTRSVLDPIWASFVARSDMLRADGVLFKGMTMHLNSSLSDGEFVFSDGQAALTLAVGTMREAIKLISQMQQPRREFLDEVMTMILIGLGANRERACLLVSEAATFIYDEAPTRLNWWRDPWVAS